MKFSNDGIAPVSQGLGLTQKWQINQHWQTDFLIDRTQTLKQTLPPLNPNVPLASGSTGGSGIRLHRDCGRRQLSERQLERQRPRRVARLRSR